MIDNRKCAFIVKTLHFPRVLLFEVRLFRARWRGFYGPYFVLESLQYSAQVCMKMSWSTCSVAALKSLKQSVSSHISLLTWERIPSQNMLEISRIKALTVWEYIFYSFSHLFLIISSPVFFLLDWNQQPGPLLRYITSFDGANIFSTKTLLQT